MRNIRVVSGDSSFINNLASLKAKFILTTSYTKTAEIEGISVAGAPGMLAYTPTADMEALHFGQAKCLPTVPENPSGPPSPVIIGMAIRKLLNFEVDLLDVGLKIKTEAPCQRFELSESGNILDEKGADVRVAEIIVKAEKYANDVKYSSDLFIIAECVPAGTTTAYATCKAFGYDCDDYTASSSHKPACNNLKREVVEKALTMHGTHEDPTKVLNLYADNMIVFNAVLAANISNSKPVVLAGGTQMLAVYAAMKQLKLKADFSNLAVITTRWVVDDEQSDFASYAKLIDPEINAFCPEFRMDSEIKNLALYEQGYVKEGVGAGALIAYAIAKGISQEEILKQVEAEYSALYVCV